METIETSGSVEPKPGTVDAALDAAKAWSGKAVGATAAKAMSLSHRETFFDAVLAAVMGDAGRGAIADIREGFKRLPREVKEPVKGGVSECLGVVEHVATGKLINATFKKDGAIKTPSFASLASLTTRGAVAVSAIVKAWRETVGVMSADASEQERSDTRVLSAGLVALGKPAGTYSGVEAFAAKAKGLTEYAGESFEDILAAGDAALAEAEALQRQEAAQRDAEAYEMAAAEYLAKMPADAYAAFLELVAESRANSAGARDAA